MTLKIKNIYKFLKNTKWYNDSIYQSIKKDFISAFSTIDINKKIIDFDCTNFRFKYFSLIFYEININNQIGIFIPIKKMNNNYIGICYVFSNDMIKKGIENLSHKSFFRLIINSPLSQFHKI